MDGDAMTPLRGRIAIRKHVPLRTGLVWHPDQAPDNERSGQRSSGVRSQSSHRGTVLGMGEAARTAKGDAPIPHGFSVGDEVVFVFALQGTEESRRGTWSDGEPCVWIAQEEVIAVVDKSHKQRVSESAEWALEQYDDTFRKLAEHDKGER